MFRGFRVSCWVGFAKLVWNRAGLSAQGNTNKGAGAHQFENLSGNLQEAGYSQDTSVVEFRVGRDEEKIGGHLDAWRAHLYLQGKMCGD